MLRVWARERLQLLLDDRNSIISSAEEITSEVDAILSYSTGLSRVKILSDPDFVINVEQVSTFVDAVERRLRFEPVAYITGKREFYGREWNVNRDVLIPRPETEHLVESALRFLNEQKRETILLELGVGSGAVIGTIVSEFKGQLSLAVGSDLSLAAINVAKSNCTKLDIKFIQADLFRGMEGIFKMEEPICCVCNPPYVGTTEELTSEVKSYEPASALFAGIDGMKVISELLQQFLLLAREKDRLIFEIGALQTTQVLSAIEKFGGKLIKVHQDLAGRDRIVEVKRRP